MMAKIKYIIIFIVLLSSCSKKEKYIQFVDPFIGTASTGHTFPGATYPFGFMQPGPQSGNFGWEHCSGYNYEDTKIWGFSQNRLNGTGVPDLGDILVMPFSKSHTADFKSSFFKDKEKATPGYYSVELIDHNVIVELTCSPHVAFHRYSFKNGNPHVYINYQSGSVSTEDQYNTRVLESQQHAEDKYTITGYQKVRGWVERQLYYVIKFSEPYITERTIVEDDRNKAPVKIYSFEKSLKQVDMKISFSTVSIENAKENMEKEVSDWNFSRIKQEAEDGWEKLLSKINVEGSLNQKKNFYTSMYHLFIQPNNISDLNGQYRGCNDSVYTSPFNKYYSTFSLWDTYRAAHPLYTLLSPDYISDLVNSMLLHADKQGFLPIWTLWGKENFCMIGNHAVPVVVEACLKNFPGIDQQKAYQMVKKTLTTNHFKSQWDIYDHYGYYPFDLVKEESVSITYETAYDDYCAAQLAKKLGYEQDYEFFIKRSGYYKNLFDPETRFARGKDSNGNWRTPFDIYHLSHAGSAGGDYTEGNAWQYTWHVQHDVEGLIDLFGSKESLVSKLDSLFIVKERAEATGFVGDVTGLIGQYAHGNEPSHHIVYLYSLLDRKDRTAELVREIFDRFYLPKPDGLCGNDDCGQMSAWYIFSSMGFYPVNPVSGEYVLGAPQIPEVTISLPDDKKFTITAQNLSEENKYVQSVSLNGVEHHGNTISHKDIMQGGTLVFQMINAPK